MFVVALTDIAGDAADEAPRLAADLGATDYEARLLVAPGAPAIVRTTPDRDAAATLLAALRARGHGVVAFDAGAVIASGDMIPMRRFRLDADAASAGPPSEERMEYDDVLAIVVAVHRTRTAAENVVHERQLSVARGVVTSGLALTKTITTTTHTETEARERVAYVFRRSGATPWLLREHGTVWTGHGQALARTTGENFQLSVAALRERAPRAAFDERLVTRRAPERATLTGGMRSTAVTVSTEATVDLLAHALAGISAARSAYR